jgi:nitrile hydratase
MFQPGDIVRIKDAWPERPGPVHIRTPWYLRGKQGQVVRLLGAYPNPEDLAFGRPAADRPLYHVRFQGSTIWPDGNPADEMQVEIYEHWLERP